MTKSRACHSPLAAHSSCRAAILPPYSAASAGAGAVRRDLAPAPLLPAGTRSLRSVSVILTSPPQQAKRARSGSLQLHSAQCEGGETKSVITGGNPEPPPAPENHGPGSMFPPDPLPASPHCGGSRCTHDRGMCKQTSAHDRGKCIGLRAAPRVYRAASGVRGNLPRQLPCRPAARALGLLSGIDLPPARFAGWLRRQTALAGPSAVTGPLRSRDGQVRCSCSCAGSK